MLRPSRKLLLLLLPVLGAATALAVPPVPKVPPPPRVPVPPPPARVVPHAPPPLPAPPVLPRVERVVPPRPGPHAGRRVPPPVLVPPPAGAPGLQVFGYRHPPREHGDREGYRWIPGRNGHEGRWAPHRRPGQHHVWVPGHWRGDLWINGHWARPHRR